MRSSFSVASLTLSIACSLVAQAQTATIDNLGTVPGAGSFPYSHARGVSADGAVVVGDAGSDSSSSAFRWTAAGDIEDLGAFDGSWYSTFARSVSGDGSVLVGGGGRSGSISTRAARVAPSGVQLLPALYEDFYAITEAHDVSASGIVVVGNSTSVEFGFQPRACRWESGSVVDLGTLEPATFVNDSAATGCSSDASVIVGRCETASGRRATLFRVGQAPQNLGTLGGNASEAHGVSANGVVIVGQSHNGSTVRAFRWTQAGGMTDLGTAGGVPGSSVAYAASFDGRIIVGQSISPSVTGGEACVWTDGVGRQLWNILQTDFNADLTGWIGFDVIRDVSPDGSTFVGSGTTSDGDTVGFRVRLSTAQPPTVTKPTPVVIECDGEPNHVALAATVNDPNAADRLTVTWRVNGTVRQTTANVVPGTTINFEYPYPHGENLVSIRVSDGVSTATATTTVTVADTQVPIVVSVSPVRVGVDRGEIFATGVRLPKPIVADVCDLIPKMVNDAPKKFPIGVTTVKWTITDAGNNRVTANQKVTVVNAAPIADAGRNIVQVTTQRRSKVTLDGRKSRDPDGHALKYRWSAGTLLQNARTARPSGYFKIGTTEVTLTVTDEAGKFSKDTVRVTIQKLKLARAAARVADDSVRQSYAHAAGVDRDVSAAAGMRSSLNAYALGALAGDDVGAAKPASTEELTDYLALRSEQSRQAELAAEQFRESFLNGGDVRSLYASLHAQAAAASARADLSSDETVDVLVTTVE